MLYSGPAFSVQALGDGIVELKFDLAGDSVNKLNQVALQDFDKATQAIAKAPVREGRDRHLGQASVHRRCRRHRVHRHVRGRRGSRRQGRARSEPDAVPLRGPAGPDGGRDQRHLPRRRPRAGARLRLPRDVDRRVGRLPRSEARHLPGLRRLRAHAARDRHRQRGRVDRDRRRQEARRRAEGRRGGRRGGARAAARRRARARQAGDRRQARLEGEARREARAREAERDRADDGVHELDGGRGRQGRPELPGADARAAQHAGVGRQGPRRGAARSRRSTSPRPR